MHGCSVKVARLSDGNFYVGRIYEECDYPEGTVCQTRYGATRHFLNCAMFCAVTARLCSGQYGTH